MTNSLPIAIIGGGPVGLAAASHLLERGENPVLFESGPEIANSIKSWQHVRLFTPWKYNIDAAARRLLTTNGWTEPDPEILPTGKELREKYLLPLYRIEAIRSRTYLSTTVIAVGKKNRDKTRDANREDLSFVVHYTHPNDGGKILEAKAIIDTSGTWTQPNPIGAGGIPAIGESENRDRIRYGIPNILDEYESTYQNKHVMVVGSGHSAMQVILDLVQLQKKYQTTRITWIMRTRKPDTVFGAGNDDELPARGSLGLKARQAVSEGLVEILTPYLIRKIKRISDNKLRVIGDYKNGPKKITVDEIIVTTGFRPDLNMIREVRTNIDPALESVASLAPMIDPNIHSCGTVPPHGVNELKHPEENFFIAGSKSYGRAPTFLMMTGYEQVRSIAAYLTGDLEAAGRIELQLPETGVCSTDIDGKYESAACCGRPAPVETNSCCAPDTVAKASGESECGYGVPANDHDHELSDKTIKTTGKSKYDQPSHLGLLFESKVSCC